MTKSLMRHPTSLGNKHLRCVELYISRIAGEVLMNIIETDIGSISWRDSPPGHLRTHRRGCAFPRTKYLQARKAILL